MIYRAIVRILTASVLLIYTCTFAAATDYLLGAGDKILISVYDEPDLKTEVKIDKSGLVSFPFLPDINVLGLATVQVEKIIKKGYYKKCNVRNSSVRKLFN